MSMWYAPLLTPPDRAQCQANSGQLRWRGLGGDPGDEADPVDDAATAMATGWPCPTRSAGSASTEGAPGRDPLPRAASLPAAPLPEESLATELLVGEASVAGFV